MEKNQRRLWDLGEGRLGRERQPSCRLDPSSPKEIGWPSRQGNGPPKGGWKGRLGRQAWVGEGGQKEGVFCPEGHENLGGAWPLVGSKETRKVLDRWI